MKAFLLAAGKGTRLRPLTNKIPKCLVPIQGRPLLHYWLTLCGSSGINEVLINVHHLADHVLDYLRSNTFGLNVVPFYEERLLGSAGTVAANRWFVEGEDDFFIFYADNLTNLDLRRFLDFHKKRRALFTMGLFRTNCPAQCGIATLDEEDIITEFIEKPEMPKTDLANAGIYLAGEELFDYIPDKETVDFGHDVVPNLVNRMHGYVISDYLVDVGTLENYERAQREWRG